VKGVQIVGSVFVVVWESSQQLIDFQKIHFPAKTLTVFLARGMSPISGDMQVRSGYQPWFCTAQDLLD
jgi:hypothetical protein